MKKFTLLLIAIFTMLVLSSCGNNQDKLGSQETSVPTQATALEVDNSANVAGLPEGYDPALEENDDSKEDITIGSSDVAGANTRAGATPVPIDPVDMPTPTPRPPLTFSYNKYTATGLGISFEAVAGYTIDETVAGNYLLTEPAELVKDSVPVQILLQITPVANSYKLSDLKNELQSKVSGLGSVNYSRWEPSGVSSRTLLKKNGYYMNFRGVLLDGTIVRGRVHMALLDGKVITLQMIWPGWYESDYVKVYTHIRDTLKTL